MDCPRFPRNFWRCRGANDWFSSCVRSMNGREPTQVRPPQRGNYAVTECVKCNALTHSHIHAKVPHAGIEPEASADADQKVTHLAKCESAKPEISNIYQSRRSHRPRVLPDLTDIAHFSERSETSVGILTDLTDFRRVRRNGGNSRRPHRSRRFFGEVGENGETPHRSHRFLARSVKTVRMPNDLADLAHFR